MLTGQAIVASEFLPRPGAKCLFLCAHNGVRVWWRLEVNVGHRIFRIVEAADFVALTKRTPDNPTRLGSKLWRDFVAKIDAHIPDLSWLL